MTLPRRLFVELLAGAGLLALGVGFGRWAAPVQEESRVVTVERVRLQEVVKLQVVTEAAKDVHRKGTQEWRKATLRDGTVVEEGHVIWDDTTHEDTRQSLSLDLSQTQTREASREESHVVVHDSAKLDVFGGVGVSSSLTSFEPAPVYLLGAQYQLLGPVGVGAWGTFEQSARPRAAGGLLVGLRF